MRCEAAHIEEEDATPSRGRDEQVAGRRARRSAAIATAEDEVWCPEIWIEVEEAGGAGVRQADEGDAALIGSEAMVP